MKVESSVKQIIVCKITNFLAFCDFTDTYKVYCAFNFELNFSVVTLCDGYTHIHLNVTKQMVII